MPTGTRGSKAKENGIKLVKSRSDQLKFKRASRAKQNIKQGILENDPNEDKRQKLDTKSTKKCFVNKQMNSAEPLKITSTDSDSSSCKENVPPSRSILARKAPKKIGTRKAKKEAEKELELPPVSEPISEPQTPSMKRKRNTSSKSKGYDFSNSPSSGEEALEEIKKHKESKSPLLVAETKVVLTTKERIALLKKKKLDAKVVVPEVEKKQEAVPEKLAIVISEEPKKLTTKERIALLRKKKLENSTKKIENSKIAEIRAKKEASAKARNELKEIAENKLKEAEITKINIEKLRAQKQSLIDREEFMKFTAGNLRQLQLPLTYSKLKASFNKLDQIVFTLHNRKDIIPVSRLERDVSYGSKTRFTSEILRKIMKIKEDCYQLEWKKNVRNQDSITEEKCLVDENYQMCVRPILEQNIGVKKTNDDLHKTPEKMSQGSRITEKTTAGGWIKMTAKHLNDRKNDFSRKLTFLAHAAHNRYLALILKESIEEINKQFPINRLKKFHSKFSEKMDEESDQESQELLDIPMVPLPLKPSVFDKKRDASADSCYSTPTNSMDQNGVVSNSGDTTSSRTKGMRNLLHGYMANQQKKIDETTGTDSGAPSACGTPRVKKEENLENLDGFSENLKKKFLERRQREQVKEVFQQQLDKNKEKQEIKSLYDIARSLKSYFTVNKAWSSDITEVVTKLIKSSATSLTPNDCEKKLKKLAGLDLIKENACLKVMVEIDGRTYVKMTPGTKLSVFRAAIDVSLERM